MFSLQYKSTPTERPPFTSDATQVVIGRGDDCDLALVDPGVSARHASIEKTSAGYFIRDLDSANGTIVNGQPATRQRLATGDEIELGSVRMRFTVVHPELGERRSTNLMQILLGLVVVGSIGLQIALLVWIFSQPHPSHLPRGKRDRSGKAAMDAAASPGRGSLPPETELTAPPPAPSPPEAPRETGNIVPAVLNRKIAVMNVGRKDSADAVLLAIRAMAQVGEPTVAPNAARISVELFNKAPQGNGLVPSQAEPVWIQVATWENFTARTFQVRVPIAPPQFGGYVVRTYYRGQLQDVAASPGLVSVAPDSLR
jgi:predicted component of type VI protein secretion system